jgi:hypothetical protein
MATTETAATRIPEALWRAKIPSILPIRTRVISGIFPRNGLASRIAGGRQFDQLEIGEAVGRDSRRPIIGASLYAWVQCGKQQVWRPSLLAVVTVASGVASIGTVFADLISVGAISLVVAAAGWGATQGRGQTPLPDLVQHFPGRALQLQHHRDQPHGVS